MINQVSDGDLEAKTFGYDAGIILDKFSSRDCAPAAGQGYGVGPQPGHGYFKRGQHHGYGDKPHPYSAILYAQLVCKVRYRLEKIGVRYPWIILEGSLGAQAIDGRRPAQRSIVIKGSVEAGTLFG